MKRAAVFIFVVITVIWMSFIFLNSSKDGNKSNSMSYKIAISIKENFSHETLNKIKVKLEKNTKYRFKNDLSVVNFVIRKFAHFSEYMILAILVYMFFSFIGFNSKHRIVYVLFICLMYAVLDEFHQSFVLQRTSKVADILIDFSGAVFITLINGIFSLINIFVNKVKYNKKVKLHE
ncbi:VanZ family protein [Haloimpatiens sp. FM7330]|uniref:VanZ family protein n=1 Tax=Haloimpatiens sp. FM7330 TaxID=3298610 RepID=UPI00363F4233